MGAYNIAFVSHLSWCSARFFLRSPYDLARSGRAVAKPLLVNGGVEYHIGEPAGLFAGLSTRFSET